MSGGVFQFREIHFKHDPKLDASIYEEILGCPCYFSRAENRIWVNQKVLAFSSQYRDPRLKKILEQNALAFLQTLGDDDDLVRQVKTLITESIAQRAPTVAEVAESLGMSDRALQRSLAKHNTSFQELIDDVRQGLAKKYIEQRYPFLDIALLLGYSEQSAFHRAFKRWTDMSPSSYRKSLSQSP